MVTIFKIWNKETGKCLIGTTRKDLNYALKLWMNNCTKKQFQNYSITEDCKEYGKNAFNIESLCTCENAGEAFEIADSYIVQLNTLEPYGYNKSFTGIRKKNPNYYNDMGKEEKEKIVQSEISDEVKEIINVDFRKKSELINKYGITGLSKNSVPQIFAERNTIEALRNLADKLEKYGSNEIYEFVPTELNLETNALKKELLELLKTPVDKISKGTYIAIPKNNIQCQRCNSFKDPKKYFYKHPDRSVSKDGYIHICKQCIGDFCRELFSSYNSVFYTILVVCQITNVIFVQDVAKMAEKSWKDRQEKVEEIFKYYMSELNYVWLNREDAPTSMLEFRHSNFEGDILSFAEHHPATPKVFIKELNKDLVKKIEDSSEAQQTDLEMKWGKGFELQEYKQLEQEYEKLEKFLPKKTELHIEALKKYIIYSLKEKIALAKGDLRDVKEWNTLADKAADNAQLKIKQLSDNFGAEVDGFAKLVEAVEEYNSVIPVLPKVRKMPYDDIDFIIWEAVNYNRRLEGKPETSYEEVYNFIDEELTKKMIDKGFTEEEIKKEKEKRNATFNDLADNYIEPLWMVPDEEDDEDDDEEGDSQ